MRPIRLALASIVALALAPGTFVRSEPRASFNWAPFTLVRVPTEPVALGPFRAEAAWEITSHNFWDGGYSALVATGPTSLLAATDTGRFLTLDTAAETPVAHGAGSVDDRPRRPGPEDKAQQDVESLTRDPETGMLWAGLEFTNRIERYSDRLRWRGGFAPPEMRDWAKNSGAEAFVRLGDGRFLVIRERADSWRSTRHRALLFAGDPLDGHRPRALTFVAPEGFRPVDLSPLGEGRALVLFRRLLPSLSTLFETAIGVIDVDEAGERSVLRPRLLARFEGRVPQDNYEGIAVTEGPDGRHVWLIADNNFMAHQRSLLLKLRWDRTPEREKARE